ncbi:Hsp20/alpha crystallin family protein [Candidatus Riflebacteria bacterium]
MSLIRILESYNPFFKDFFADRHDLDFTLERNFPFDLRSRPLGSFPSINIEEDEETVRVDVRAPGINKDELALSVQENILTLEGKRKKAYDAKKVNVYRSERFSGSFKRVITLPDSVDPGKVEANYRDGILRVTFEKSDQKKLKKIRISG